jgi:hypothetical protein
MTLRMKVHISLQVYHLLYLFIFEIEMPLKTYEVGVTSQQKMGMVGLCWLGFKFKNFTKF